MELLQYLQHNWTLLVADVNGGCKVSQLRALGDACVAGRGEIIGQLPLSSTIP